VVLVSFIDSLGSHLLFPFFSLYITQKFNIGMTQAGITWGYTLPPGWLAAWSEAR
jgi:hypothetical protein